MNTKLKNTLIILVILISIAAVGVTFTYVIQRGKIKDREKRVKDLTVFQLDTETLQEKLLSVKRKVAQLDSILATRKYILPSNVSQSKFFDFVNQASFSFSEYSYVNIEYLLIKTEKNYNVYEYTLSGAAEYNDFNKLLYAIEQSKAIKKVSLIDLSNSVKLGEDGIAHYLVTYKLKASVLFSDDPKIGTADYTENSLIPNPLYNSFYPLIRNEIPPNVDRLLDVQNGKLLALIPDGAFLSDASGNTYLLWEGDKVYLGYITKIDYEKNQVQFILNKGGIIEKLTLDLQKEIKQSK
jgi:hypothetical protein